MSIVLVGLIVILEAPHYHSPAFLHDHEYDSDPEDVWWG